MVGLFQGHRFVISGMEAESSHYLYARPNPDACWCPQTGSSLNQAYLMLGKALL